MDEVPVYFVKFSNQNNIDTEWDEEEMEKKGGGGMNGDDNESEDSMAFGLDDPTEREFNPLDSLSMIVCE